METIFNLKAIHVTHLNGDIKTFSNEPDVRKDFNESLPIHQLNEMKELNFHYELDLKLIIDERPGEWKVQNDSFKKIKDFFSFTCNDEDQFLEIFENKLRHVIKLDFTDKYRQGDFQEHLGY